MKIVFLGVGLIAICFILLFAGVGVASATGYYVSLAGNDANNGTTLDAAWRHIDHAVDYVSTGDTIYVVPGNYGAEHVTITTSGIALNPIKITRCGTSGTITLKHDIGRTGIGVRVYGNYWIIEHFNVSDYESGLFINGDYNTINFVEVHGETDWGFTVSSAAGGGDHNVFNECVAHDMPRGAVSNEGNGFIIKGNYNLIKDCKAYNIGHFGAGVGGVGNVIDGGEYWNIYDDTALAVGPSGTDTIFKNIFVHDTHDGIRTYFGTVNTTIENCTITNMTDRNGIAMYGSGIVTKNVIRNWNLYGTWVSGSNVTYSENDMQDLSLHEYMFTTWLSSDYMGVIKNQKGSSFTIKLSEYAGATEPATVRIEYTNGKTFSVNDYGNYTSYMINSIGMFNIEVFGDASAGTISGTVTNTTGASIQEATVSDDIKSTTTDKYGKYTITDIPIGVDTVTCIKGGYIPQSHTNVEVRKDETTTIDFALVQKEPWFEWPSLPSFTPPSFAYIEEIIFAVGGVVVLWLIFVWWKDEPKGKKQYVKSHSKMVPSRRVPKGKKTHIKSYLRGVARKGTHRREKR